MTYRKAFFEEDVSFLWFSLGSLSLPRMFLHTRAINVKSAQHCSIRHAPLTKVYAAATAIGLYAHVLHRFGDLGI